MQELSQTSKTKTDLCSICCMQYESHFQQNVRPPQICYLCWFNHLKASITKISYKIGTNVMSPFEGGDDIDVCLALGSLKQDDKNNLEEWLFKKYTTFTNDIQKCPSETCDFVFMNQKCRWGSAKNYNCPKCDMPLVASKTNGLKSIFGFIYLLLFVKKCPKCQIPIDKISGCPHMTCPCGHEFCWYCLKDYNSSVPHQPRKCAIIVMTKMIMLIGISITLIPILFGIDVFSTFLSFLGTLFGVLIRMIVMDLVIAFQVFSGFIITGPRYDSRRKGFLSSVDPKKYFCVLFLVDIGLIALLYWMQELWFFFTIFIGQLFLAGFLTGSFMLIVFSSDTWFQYIA